uniref:Uncharacterized protein n=1 Tax=Parascaris equorum TaxID=6256 RepID=A0A914R8S8_PAREQ
MIAILLFAQSTAFACVVIAQFGQPMALLSVCTSFNIAAIAVLLVTSWRQSNSCGVRQRDCYDCAVWVHKYLLEGDSKLKS